MNNSKHNLEHRLKNFVMITSLLMIGQILNISVAQDSDNQFVNIRFHEYMLHDRFNSDNWNYEWELNGQSFDNKIENYSLPVNYPYFDTLIFSNRYRNSIDTILIRINPEYDYLLHIGCCDEGFDLSKIDSVNSICEKDTSSFPQYESGFIRFQVENLPHHDTLIGVYGDVASTPYLILDADKAMSEFIKPCKIGYSTSISRVVICKEKNVKKSEIKIDPDGFARLEILREFKIRLFENEKITVKYDFENDILTVIQVN